MARSELYFDTHYERPTRWFRAVALFFAVFIALVGVWAASPLVISRLNGSLTRAAAPTIAPAPPVAAVAEPAVEEVAADDPVEESATGPVTTASTEQLAALVSPFTQLPTGWTAPPPDMIDANPFPTVVFRVAPAWPALASATTAPFPAAQEEALLPGEILTNVPLPRKRPVLVAGIPLPRARPALSADTGAQYQSPLVPQTWREGL